MKLYRFDLLPSIGIYFVLILISEVLLIVKQGEMVRLLHKIHQTINNNNIWPWS